MANNNTALVLDATNPYRNYNASEVEREALATGNALALRVLDLAEEAVDTYKEENGTPDYWRNKGARWVGEVTGSEWYRELEKLILKLGRCTTKVARQQVVDELLDYVRDHQDHARGLREAIRFGHAE